MRTIGFLFLLIPAMVVATPDDRRLPPVIPGESVQKGTRSMKTWSTAGQADAPIEVTAPEAPRAPVAPVAPTLDDPSGSRSGTLDGAALGIFVDRRRETGEKK